jgi:hypothetical protein
MIAYDTAPWGNFFFAEVGASAALVGLLFVAVSINLAKIVAAPALPGRAIEALLVLVLVLFVATFGLVPGQSNTSYGIEVLVTAALTWAATIIVQSRAPREPNEPRMWMASRVLTSQAATLPMIIAGISVLVGRGGGLYWTVVGVITSFSAALIDAWVLLVEIQR